MTRIPSSVAEVYEKNGHKESIPLNECERLLIDLASDMRSVYLVFDGLDESGHRRPFLQSILNVARSDHVRLLVTSRPHIPDLVNLFQQHPNLMIEAHEEDLRTYLYQELEQGEIYNIADQEFVNKLVLKLTKGAEGMYASLLPPSYAMVTRLIQDREFTNIGYLLMIGFFSQSCDSVPFSKSLP